MRITSDRMEITEAEAIQWSEVESLRLLNEKLVLLLKNGQTIELAHLHPSFIDHAFRSYEIYLARHAKSRKKRPPQAR